MLILVRLWRKQVTVFSWSVGAGAAVQRAPALTLQLAEAPVQRSVRPHRRVHLWQERAIPELLLVTLRPKPLPLRTTKVSWIVALLWRCVYTLLCRFFLFTKSHLRPLQAPKLKLFQVASNLLIAKLACCKEAQHGCMG